MTNTVLLDNVTHQDLHVQTHYSAQFGDNITSTLTFPTEFANVQKEYPILFHKNAQSGEWLSVVLLGLTKGENLFLSESAPVAVCQDAVCQGSWLANYVPAMIAKGPFVIGMHGDKEAPQMMVHVDMDSPRINKQEGKRVFLEQGGNSDYLNYITTLLKTIHDGMQISQAMFAAFEQHQLIEPVTMDINLANGEALRIDGHYTISEEKLAGLSAEALYELNQKGFLQGAFLVAASLTNMRKLIDMKNARILAQQ